MQEILLLSVGENMFNNSNAVIILNEKTYHPMPFEVSHHQKNANLQADEILFKVIYSTIIPDAKTAMQLFESRQFVLSKFNDGKVEVITQGAVYNVETKTSCVEVTVQNMLYKLKTPATKRYSQKCRASFCDSACSLAIANHTHNVTVAEVKSHSIQVVDELPAKHWQNGVGQIAIEGKTYYMPVRGINGTEVLFFDRLPLGIQVGDSVKVQASCNKLLATCSDVYNNAVNFRGEPFIWR